MASRSHNLTLLAILGRTVGIQYGLSDLDARKSQVAANFADPTLDLEYVALPSGANVADVNVHTDASLFELLGGRDGHAAGPVDKSGRDGAVKDLFAVDVLCFERQMGNHAARGGGCRDYLDRGEEEVVDGRVWLNGGPMCSHVGQHVCVLAGTSGLLCCCR